MVPIRRDERSHDDGCVMGPSEVHSYLTRVLHNRRNKGDPLWNTMVVGGVDHAGKRWVFVDQGRVLWCVVVMEVIP